MLLRRRATLCDEGEQRPCDGLRGGAKSLDEGDAPGDGSASALRRGKERSSEG